MHPTKQKPEVSQKHKNPAGTVLLIFALLALSVYALIRSLLPAGDHIRTADRPIPEETEQQLLLLSETMEDVLFILENSEQYPSSLLKLLAKNTETVEFVKNYPEKGLISPAETIGSVDGQEIPLLMQWDERWGYATYGSDFLAITGCGPTCLSMVAAGLTGDETITPYAVAEFAEKHGYYARGYGSSWTLMSEGSANYHLICKELPLDHQVMLRELQAGKPIICSMNAGDFTDSGHYIVIVGEEDGLFRVHDPNSQELSSSLWSYDRISGQIGNLWSFCLDE